MEQDRISATPLSRITVIDALRGFALLGVILVHMSQRFGIYSFNIEPIESLFPQINEAIEWFIRNVVMGKFINIFALLFGMSFFIQMDSAARKGVDFRKRFVWRMAILFIIGIISNCFYSGDILTIYAVFGVLMVVLFRFKNWMLMVIAIMLLIGTPRIVSSIYDKYTKIEQVETAQQPAPRPQNPTTIEQPTFLNAAARNLTTGFQGKINYQFGVNGRGFLTLALFIIGLLVGRIRFFEQINTHKRRNIYLLAVFVVITILSNAIISALPELPSWRDMDRGLSAANLTVYALRDISSVTFSAAIVIAFILIYQFKVGAKILDIMTPYGRMGLTNYVGQSIIGAFLFSMWAFGSIFGAIAATELFIIGILLYIIQIVISKYWLKYFLYGPFEWAWRTATYLKIQPLKRK